MTFPLVPLRRWADCLDGRRVPLNATERAEVPGEVPYWGANGVVDFVADALFNEVLVLLGEDGAPFFDKSKEVAFVTKGPVWPNNHIHVLRPRLDADPRFLAYALNAYDYAAVISGSTRDKLTQSDMSGMLLPRPSLSEQRVIADFLDAETARIDSLGFLAGRRHVLAQERYDASRATMVLRGLNPVTGKGCETAWPISKLGIAIALQRGHDLPHESRRHGDVPVVSSGGVSGWHDVAACQPPGVVTGRYGTIGEVFLIDRPYWPLNTTLYVSDFRGCVPSWVRHLLSCLPLDAESEKSAVGGIDRKVIGDLRVPAPPPHEQEAIARDIDHLHSITDRACKNLLEQARLLQERKQALITAAMTGQLDLARGLAEEAS